jgi:hypothetical protein
LTDQALMPKNENFKPAQTAKHLQGGFYETEFVTSK